jgi:flagellar biosynthesis anti-sigma factor FlgM
MEIQTLFTQVQAVQQTWSRSGEVRDYSNNKELQSLESLSEGSRSEVSLQRMAGQLKAEMSSPDKVADIKAKIAAGTFEINNQKIADELLWSEQGAVFH